MPEIGDLRVYHIWEQVGIEQHQTRYFPVKSVGEARRLIDARAELQVNDEYVNWNVFGLEVYDADDGTGNPGWCEWYDENGNDIGHIDDDQQLPESICDDGTIAV